MRVSGGWMPRNNGPGLAAAGGTPAGRRALAGFPRADLAGLTWACGHGGVAIAGSLA
jgi:hypothetical protein